MVRPRLHGRAQSWPTRPALLAPEGPYSYAGLLDSATATAAALLAGSADLNEARVALLTPPGFRYVAAQWGTWFAGAISVPLHPAHPAAEMDYVLEDSGVTTLIAASALSDIAEPLARRHRTRLLWVDDIEPAAGAIGLPDLDKSRRALILYTSGSTGKPKGVVWTHANLEAQLEILSDAWGWLPDDRSLLVLPLHHVHGLVNVLTCSLWNGATCEIADGFDAAAVWDRLASGEISVFMAVPTIYHRLIETWEAAPSSQQQRMAAGASGLRLMVSGSAALPVPTLDRWKEITGHTLLERYGMTEIGMALSNSYRGDRLAGSVGTPLPSVDVRLVSAGSDPVAADESGEIQVRGPSVFKEYWERPAATRDSFVDGWFRTGDIAVVERGAYRILGRSSVDIIKTGGEKVSALEIEDVLRTDPAVADCAVVGVPDPAWGEIVVAAVVPTRGATPSLESIQDGARRSLADAKVPRRLVLLKELPRNAMGKVVKTELKASLEAPPPK